MKRWDRVTKENREFPQVDAFIAEIADVCRKHGLSIGHEDGYGAFIVEKGDDNIDWLEAAIVDLS